MERKVDEYYWVQLKSNPGKWKMAYYNQDGWEVGKDIIERRIEKRLISIIENITHYLGANNTKGTTLKLK